VTIRILESGDATAYQEFRLIALRACPEAFGSTFEEEVLMTESEIAARVRPTADQFVLGAFEPENRLIGVAGVIRPTRAKRRHGAQIWGMYVAAEARGRGAGNALLSNLIARTRQLDGLLQVHLSVITTCQSARRLYLVHGFEPYGIEPRAHMQDGELLDIEHMILRLS
jgi:GNAT superfamily N-acetyltransferase